MARGIAANRLFAVTATGSEEKYENDRHYQDSEPGGAAVDEEQGVLPQTGVYALPDRGWWLVRHESCQPGGEEAGSVSISVAVRTRQATNRS